MRGEYIDTEWIKANVKHMIFEHDILNRDFCSVEST